MYLKRRKVRNQKMNKKAKLSMGKIVERFSYGCGDFGCNIIYTAMSAFLVFYYTDYAGVNALAVGTIMMVSRIFDGISDIIMGVVVDRTKSRFGKARSWILRMCSLRYLEYCCFLYRHRGHLHQNWFIYLSRIISCQRLFTLRSMFHTLRSMR